MDWWESHPVQDREALTWLQFRERFHSHNVPAGVMKMKQKEFLALKQVISNIIIQHFSFELIPPCSIRLNHKLILRYIYLSFSLQGTMTVTEYRDRFLQLARYAPADFADDHKKQEHFMEGLEDYLSVRADQPPLRRLQPSG